MTTPDPTPNDIAEDINAAAEHISGELERAATALEAIAATATTAATTLRRDTALAFDHLDELAAQVAALTPTPTPPGTLYGYVFNGVGRWGLTKAGVVRDFTPGAVMELAKIRRTLNAGSALWYSWKPNILNNAWLTLVETQLRTVVTADSPPLFLTVWHEPEGEGDAGGGIPAVRIPRWQAAQTALHTIALRLRADGIPVFIAPVVCDWTFWWTSKGSAAEWYDFDGYDVMGFDVYPQGQKANGVSHIARLTTTGPNTVAPYAEARRNDTYRANRLCSEHAARAGKPWGSAETGVIDGSRTGADVLHPYTLGQRADRMTAIAADLATLDHPPALWCWYPDGGCVPASASDPMVAAWNATIATNPTVDQVKAAML